MSNNQSRVAWIDNLKAIGIFLVVFAHHEHEIPQTLLKYLYSFHVPLFFFASGLVFMVQKYSGFKELLVNKIRTLIIPYFSFSFLTLGFWLAIAPFRGGEPFPTLQDILWGVTGVIVSSNGLIWMVHNAPLWFLTCLFIVQVLFYLLYGLSLRLINFKSMLTLACFVTLLSVLGALDRLYMPIRLPWGVDTALTGIGFFFVGFVTRTWLQSSVSNKLTLIKIVLLTTLFAISLTFSHINDLVNIAFNRMGNYFEFYVASFSGIGICILISKVIPENKIFSFVGRNSLAILALHLPAYLVIRGVQKFIPWIAWLDTTYSSFLSALVYSVMQIVMITPVIYSINRFPPFMLGRKKISGLHQHYL